MTPSTVRVRTVWPLRGASRRSRRRCRPVGTSWPGHRRCLPPAPLDERTGSRSLRTPGHCPRLTPGSSSCKTRGRPSPRCCSTLCASPAPPAAADAPPRGAAQAVLHKGGDTPGSPGEGDLVVCHLSLRTCDDEERLVFTTRLDEGGAGVPLREALASDACALLRGVELALAALTRGERAVLRLPPEFAFGASQYLPPGVVSLLIHRLCCVQATRAAPADGWHRRGACPPSTTCLRMSSCWTFTPARRARLSLAD